MNDSSRSIVPSREVQPSLPLDKFVRIKVDLWIELLN